MDFDDIYTKMTGRMGRRLTKWKLGGDEVSNLVKTGDDLLKIRYSGKRHDWPQWRSASWRTRYNTTRKRGFGTEAERSRAPIN